MNEHPGIKRASYVADAAVSAVLADKVARRRVRQGVPPEEAAHQATLSVMMAGSIGVIILLQFGVLMGLAVAATKLDIGGTVGMSVMTLYGLVILYGAWVYMHVAPHRKTARQRSMSNIWFLIVLAVGWWPMFIACMFGAWGLDKILGVN